MNPSLRREVHEAVDLILDMLAIAIEDQKAPKKQVRKKARSKKKRQQVA